MACLESPSLLDQLKSLELQIQHIRRHVEQQTTNSSKHNRPPVKNQGKQRSKDKKPSAYNVSALLHLPEALQANILEFTQNLDLGSDTELLDELFQERCITEDDYHAIRRRLGSDQARYLVVKVKCRPPTVIQKFLDILKDRKYDYIVNKILASRDKLKQERSNKITCVICVMKTMVDIKDVADYMWKKNILESDIYHNLVVSDNPQLYRRQFWEHVTTAINEKRIDLTSLAQVMNVVGYGHLGSYMKELPKGSKLECCCMCRKQPQPKSNRESVASTQSEFSTTSEVPRSNRDSMLSEVDEGVQFRKSRRHRQIKETKELLQNKTVSDIIKEVESECVTTTTISDVNVGQIGVKELFESSTETLRPTSEGDNDETCVKVIFSEDGSNESGANSQVSSYDERVAPELSTAERSPFKSILHVFPISQQHQLEFKPREATEPRLVYRHHSTGYTPSDKLDECYTHSDPADSLDYPDSSVQMRYAPATPTTHMIQMNTQNTTPVRQKISVFERIAHRTEHQNETYGLSQGLNPAVLRHSSVRQYARDLSNRHKPWKSEAFLTLQKGQSQKALVDFPSSERELDLHKSHHSAHAYDNTTQHGNRDVGASLIGTEPVRDEGYTSAYTSDRADSSVNDGMQVDDIAYTGFRTDEDTNTRVKTDDDKIVMVQTDDKNANVFSSDNTSADFRTDNDTTMGDHADKYTHVGVRTNYDTNSGVYTCENTNARVETADKTNGGVYTDGSSNAGVIAECTSNQEVINIPYIDDSPL